MQGGGTEPWGRWLGLSWAFGSRNHPQEPGSKLPGDGILWEGRNTSSPAASGRATTLCLCCTNIARLGLDSWEFLLLLLVTLTSGCPSPDLGPSVFFAAPSGLVLLFFHPGISESISRIFPELWTAPRKPKADGNPVENHQDGCVASLAPAISMRQCKTTGSCSTTALKNFPCAPFQLGRVLPFPAVPPNVQRKPFLEHAEPGAEGAEDAQAGWDLYVEMRGRNQTSSFHRMLGHLCVCQRSSRPSLLAPSSLPSLISISEAGLNLPEQKCPCWATLVFPELCPKALC